MYALIHGYRGTLVDQMTQEMPSTAEPRVVSTHRSLPAAQKAWRKFTKRPAWDKGDSSPYDMLGILGPTGLLNYFGERLKGVEGARIEVRMGTFND
jgi:hypothetical protein